VKHQWKSEEEAIAFATRRKGEVNRVAKTLIWKQHPGLHTIGVGDYLQKEHGFLVIFK
jgi:hypothetical protein